MPVGSLTFRRAEAHRAFHLYYLAFIQKTVDNNSRKNKNTLDRTSRALPNFALLSTSPGKYGTDYYAPEHPNSHREPPSFATLHDYVIFARAGEESSDEHGDKTDTRSNSRAIDDEVASNRR
jgi:hypothetical protein